MDNPRERLLALVAEAREARGLGRQADLVKATGLSRSTVHRFEQGEPVSETALRRISEAVGWKPDSAQDVLAGGEPIAGTGLEDRYRRQEAMTPGLSVGVVEDMLYEAFIAGAPGAPLEDYDKAKRAAFEFLRRNGIEVKLKHPETSTGTHADS